MRAVDPTLLQYGRVDIHQRKGVLLIALQFSRVDKHWLVVIQPYILVSKLKKIKTKFLRNSIKNPIKQDLLLILVLVRQQNFLNC